MLKLANDLDAVGQPELADEIDYQWVSDALAERDVPQPWDDDPVEWVGRKFLEGDDLNRIAGTVGVSIGRIRELLARFWARHPSLESKYRVRVRSKEVSWEDIEKIAEALDLGFTMAEVADLYDISSATVARYYSFYRERYPDRSPEGPPSISVGKAKKFSQERAEAMSDVIANLRRSGLTWDEIAEKLGAKFYTVISLFDNYYAPRNPDDEIVADRRSRREFSTEDAELIKERYLRGVPGVELMRGLNGNVARKLNASEVSQILNPKQLREVLDSERFRSKASNLSVLEEAERAGEMALESRTNSEIAEEIGCHKNKVSYFLRVFTAMHPELAEEMKKVKLSRLRN